MTKLAIGTAQLGSSYGVLNNSIIKKNDFKKIEKIIKKNKIKYIDTALDYGISQERLSRSKLKKLNIISKIKFNNSEKNFFFHKYLNKVFNKNLKILKLKKIYCLMIHDTKVLFSNKSQIVINYLNQLKKKKLISKIGVSVYSPTELRNVMKILDVDIIQIPVNVMDQRFLKNNLLKKLKKKNILIFARSIFLQGLLLQSEVPKNFFKYKAEFNKFFLWCEQFEVSKVSACINFVKNIKEIDYLIVGFNNSNQLLQIVEGYKKKVKVPRIFFSKKNKLIDPREWRYN